MNMSQVVILKNFIAIVVSEVTETLKGFVLTRVIPFIVPPYSTLLNWFILAKSFIVMLWFFNNSMFDLKRSTPSLFFQPKRGMFFVPEACKTIGASPNIIK